MANGHKPRNAAVKRIKVTGSGKLRHRKAGLTHLQTKRSSKSQMTNADGAQAIAKSDVRAQERMLGLG
jgi:large subunit ribosomal protein L35